MSEHIYNKYLKYLITICYVLALGFSLSTPAFAALVNINTAGVTELKTLSGIGDVKAQAIIDYRVQHGSFAKIEDIKNVSGIGDATYNNIKDFITVGEVATQNNQNQATQEQTSTTTPASTEKAVWLVQNKSKYEVDIDTERSSVVGTPIEFHALTNFGYAKNSIFEWSFGDGSIAYGADNTHTYNFPGEYVVIMKVSLPGEVITSRTTVKILEPEILISFASQERIEIANNSKDEVNLFGRALLHSGVTFTFPKDLIVLAGQKINLSSSVTGLTPANTSEVYLMTVGDNPSKSVNGVTMLEETRLKEITLIKNKVSELENKLSLAYQNNIPKTVGTITEPVAHAVPIEEAQSETLVANALASVEPIEELSWFARLKKFFLRTE